MNPVAIGFFVTTILVTLAITVWAARRSSGRADYYVAGGEVTGLQNGFAIAGDFMSATTFLGVTGIYLSTGIDVAAIFYLAPLIGLCLLLLLVAAPLRRSGKFTLGDVLTSRGEARTLRVFAGFSTVIVSLINLIGQLVGAGVLIGALFGLDFTAAVVIVGLLMISYVTFGGMLAATWVQIIKAMLLVAVVVVLSVVCIVEGGGLGALYERAAAVHPLGRGLFAPGGSHTTLFSAVSLAFGLAVGMLGMPHLLIRFFTVPSERAATQSALSATTIVGVIFLLMFAVIGPGTVAFVAPVADYHTATGGLLGGPNMGPIHLATALGGQGLRGITSAVAFATILAVVSGLVMATASAASHDLCAKLWRRPMAETEELAVFRGAAAVMGIVAVLLAIAFQRENVALFTAIAFSVAASANVPVLLLTFYWPRLTAAGALAGGLTGLAGSVLLIILGPLVWVKLLGHAQPVFPSEFPALVSLPLAMIAAIVVSLAAPEGRLQPVPVMPEGN